MVLLFGYLRRCLKHLNRSRRGQERVVDKIVIGSINLGGGRIKYDSKHPIFCFNLYVIDAEGVAVLICFVGQLFKNNVIVVVNYKLCEH